MSTTVLQALLGKNAQHTHLPLCTIKVKVYCQRQRTHHTTELTSTLKKPLLPNTYTYKHTRAYLYNANSTDLPQQIAQN